MKKKISLISVIALCALTAVLTFQLTLHFVGKRYQERLDAVAISGSDFSMLSEAEEVVRSDFLGVIDNESTLHGALKGYIAGLNDPYSRYLTKEEYDAFQQSLSGAASGIGIRATQDPDTMRVVVYSVVAGSPAENAGIRKGDVLYRVDDNAVSDLGFYNAVRALSGEAGSTVKVTFLRNVAAKEMELTFTLTRSEIRVNSVSYEMLPDQIGYVQIYSIDSGTDREFEDAVNSLVEAGAAGFVFDLRNNSGGDVAAVTRMLDMLLPRGEMFCRTTSDGTEVTVESDEHCIRLPMAVLINGDTASAAELFAAVLQDQSYAEIVGKRSFGKGVGQKVVPLSDGSALVVTTERFRAVGGTSFDEKGVFPDVEVELEKENLYLISHAQDAQLQEAIGLLKQ